MKKQLAFVLMLAVVLSLAACGSAQQVTDEPTAQASSSAAPEPQAPPEYVYKDAVASLSANWNPHTLRSAGDAYPLQFISAGLYSFVYRDASHPQEDEEGFASFAVMPEMAAEMPADVTAEAKAEWPEFGIPENAAAGYAFRIALNPQAVWQDGTPINADTYVGSMQRLLDPALMNYRASDYYDGSLRLAGARAYACSGEKEIKANAPDGESALYELADLVRGDDGVYTTAEGYVCCLGLRDTRCGRLDGTALQDYYDHGMIPEETWKKISAGADDQGYVPLTDAVKEAFCSFIAGDDWDGEAEEAIALYLFYEYIAPETDFSAVGIRRTGDYEITLILERPLSRYALLDALRNNWIVKTDLYDSCIREQDGVRVNSYGTSPETSASCGPYVMTEYTAGEHMHFERSGNWYGWTDARHTFTDPADGKICSMYQTTAIDTLAVPDAAERKALFLQGRLMHFALQEDDLEEYGRSDCAYAEPGSGVSFLILNGYAEAAEQREAGREFDGTAYDLQTLTLPAFRRATALSFDRDRFAAALSPLCSGSLGLFGAACLSDPENGICYRDTEPAKAVLSAVYGPGAASPDGGAAASAGYDPEAAKALYGEAFREALERKYISDEDGDGVSDQTIRISYAAAADPDLVSRIVGQLNAMTAEAVSGTPFEGKVEFVETEPADGGWRKQIRTGAADAVLAGWNSTGTDPFVLTGLYTDPAMQFDAGWFDAAAEQMTLTVNGEELTASLKDWSDALNGALVRIGDREYCFGSGAADPETRLNILAAFEQAVLETGNYLPMLESRSVSLLSRQLRYVYGEYDPVMQRGGLAYLRYRYSEAEWESYTASQGGKVSY